MPLRHLIHKIKHPLFDSAEVLVFKLLPFRRRRAYERAAGHDQVLPEVVIILIDKEILLLRAAGRIYFFDVFVAKEFSRLTAALLNASSERSKGSFWSKASPW